MGQWVCWVIYSRDGGSVCATWLTLKSNCKAARPSWHSDRKQARTRESGLINSSGFSNANDAQRFLILWDWSLSLWKAFNSLIFFFPFFCNNYSVNSRNTEFMLQRNPQRICACMWLDQVDHTVIGQMNERAGILIISPIIALWHNSCHR